MAELYPGAVLRPQIVPWPLVSLPVPSYPRPLAAVDSKRGLVGTNATSSRAGNCGGDGDGSAVWLALQSWCKGLLWGAWGDAGGREDATREDATREDATRGALGEGGGRVILVVGGYFPLDTPAFLLYSPQCVFPYTHPRIFPQSAGTGKSLLLVFTPV